VASTGSDRSWLRSRCWSWALGPSSTRLMRRTTRGYPMMNRLISSVRKHGLPRCEKQLQVNRPSGSTRARNDLSDDEQIDVQKLGCSDRAQTASFREVFNSKPDDFSYPIEFLPPLAIGLAITLGLTLFVYGLVRAIGWVIGGFAAS
jgi:hypothetical protein